MKRLVFLAVAVFAASLTGTAWAVEYRGVPVLEDADAFKLPDAAIRLHGIDTPELAQTCLDAEGKQFACGMRAKEAMEAIIGGREVVCVQRENDRFERAVSVCKIGELDIAAELVRQGWGVAFWRYSLDYVTQEDEAKAAKRGLWAGRFEMPWNWRDNQRMRPAPLPQ